MEKNNNALNANELSFLEEKMRLNEYNWAYIISRYKSIKNWINKQTEYHENIKKIDK